MMKNHRLLWYVPITLLVISIVVNGCTTIKNQIDLPPEANAPSLKIAQTHFHDILDIFGPPAQITALPEGFAFLYESLRIQENQLGISLGKDTLSLFKLALGKADVDRQIRILVFDKSGFLRSHSHRTIHEDVGKGSAIQFLVKVEQMVDTKYLENDSVQHDWGFSLLKPLPHALNLGQSLDSGAKGMEQRGTPTEVGQRALEMH